jgi:hypothetical protein
LLSSKRLPVFELTDQQDHEYSALLAERDRVLLALEELDFDYAMGKIPKRIILLNAPSCFRLGQIFYASWTNFLFTERKQLKRVLETRLEASLTEKRAIRTAPAAVGTAVNGGEGADDDLEVLIASRRRARNGKSAGFCPQCGRPLQKSDRFCPKCGATVK